MLLIDHFISIIRRTIRSCLILRRTDATMLPATPSVAALLAIRVLSPAPADHFPATVAQRPPMPTIEPQVPEAPPSLVGSSSYDSMDARCRSCLIQAARRTSFLSVDCAGALHQARYLQSSVLSEDSCSGAGRNTSLYTAELSLEK